MKAIDVHAHVSTQVGRNTLSRYHQKMEEYYRMKVPLRTEEEMANDFRDADCKVFLVAVDAETATGLPRTSNDYIAGLVKSFPDVFIGGFASVDPWKGEMAIKEVGRAIKELGLKGVKFAQALQQFFPNDRRFYPLWEKCAELKIHLQFHMGTTGIGAGLPGGMGIHLKYTRPIPYLDDLAADFPDLTIIGCHPAWPWQEEMLALVQHKSNVFMELSGWSPKYFPESLKREIKGRLQDRVMFGSDYPGITPQRWLSDFEKEGYPLEIVEKVFYKNAQRILKIKEGV